jgi:N-acetylneuraminic acid mutarotase
MIVWGGWGPEGSTGLGDGARYDPATDRWQPVSTRDAPRPRYDHLAVWTGHEMIVWGGADADGPNGDGARYDPATDSWSPLPPGPLQPRVNFGAVWTGDELIIWGGYRGNPSDPLAAERRSVYLDDGARYSPTLNRWVPMRGAGAPDGRYNPAVAWTGEEMIVWSGVGEGSQARPDGARYNPTTDTWRPMSSAAPPVAMGSRPAIWTGTELLLWGATAGRDDIGQGARYDPLQDTWASMSTDGAPLGRLEHTAVWTGTELIVWGGESRFTRGGPSPLRTDAGRYHPATDTWTAIPTEDSTPSPRVLHTAVWNGDEMIIWGGAAAPNGTTPTMGHDSCRPASCLNVAQTAGVRHVGRPPTTRWTRA